MRTKNLRLWLGGLFLFLPAAAPLAGMEKDPGPLPVELVQPVFDSQLTGSPHGVTIRRDAATIELIEGRIGFGQAVALDPDGERRVFDSSIALQAADVDDVSGCLSAKRHEQDGCAIGARILETGLERRQGLLAPH